MSENNNHHDKLEPFIGPDGSMLLHRNTEACPCEDCEAARWQKIEREELGRAARRNASEEEGRA